MRHSGFGLKQAGGSSKPAFSKDMTATVSSSFKLFVVLSATTLTKIFSCNFQETRSRQCLCDGI